MFRKMQKVNAICFICIAVLLITLSACDREIKVAYAGSFNGKEIPVDVANNVEHAIMLNLAEKVNSYEELVELSNDKNLHFYDDTNGYYDASLYNKIRNYDNKFFRNKSLIIVFRFKTSYEKLEFNNFKIEENVVTIELLNMSCCNKVDCDEAAVMTAHVFFIETNKNLTETVNQINVQEISKNEI